MDEETIKNRVSSMLTGLLEHPDRLQSLTCHLTEMIVEAGHTNTATHYAATQGLSSVAHVSYFAPSYTYAIPETQSHSSYLGPPSGFYSC